MPRTPSESVSRQNQTTTNENAMHEVLSEDERMEPGLPLPVLRETDRLRVAKWKIRSAYHYLAFTSALCTGAIVLDPSDNVRLVALAIWSSAAAVGGALLRRAYRKT